MKPERKPFFLEEPFEPVDHLVVGKPAVALADHALGGEEQLRVHDRLEGAVGPDPFFRWVVPVFVLQLVGMPVEDVVADVFLVGENLVDGAVRPGPAEIRQDSRLVEQRGDLAFQPASVDELAVHPPDGLDFLFRSGHEDHPVCLQALALTPVKNALRLAILVDAHAA